VGEVLDWCCAEAHQSRTPMGLARWVLAAVVPKTGWEKIAVARAWRYVGLKPESFDAPYAALKGRSSTVVLAASARWSAGLGQF
jgi:hypothetical protein